MGPVSAHVRHSKAQEAAVTEREQDLTPLSALGTGRKRSGRVREQRPVYVDPAQPLAISRSAARWLSYAARPARVRDSQVRGRLPT